MKAQKSQIFTVEAYLKQEIATNTKHEFHDGKIYALAGGTVNHGKISGNIYNELRNQLKSKKSRCLPFNSDVKLHITATKSYVYPDAMVVCEEKNEGSEDELSVKNPILIIEVLSKSTSGYDRGDKFYLYRQIPTFKEYVLIEQDKHVVDVHYKNENSDLWRITRYNGLDAIVKLQSLNIEISMEDLYYSTEMKDLL